MAVFGCIADDFTGASDAASFLVKGGMSVRLCSGIPQAEGSPEAEDAQAVVIALKSRTQKTDEAVADSVRAAEYLLRQGVQQIYFKYCSTFDSTPEGNIGPVADALMDLTGSPCTVLCPALPVNGRTVEGGRLLVNGVPLHESPMKDHPLTPMWDCRIHKLMEPQSRYACFYISREGLDNLENLPDQPCYLIPDYQDAGDGERIASACFHLPFLTGGSGLLEPLAKLWTKKLSGAGKIPESGTRGRALLVAGSCSKATLGQIAWYRDQGNPCYKLDPQAMLEGRQTLEDAWNFIEANSGEDTAALVYSSDTPEKVKEYQRLGAEKVAAMLEDAMAQLAVRAVKAGYTRIISAGGETSGAVAGGLGFASCWIGQSVAPGVPVMIPVERPDIRMVLKSGNFGQEDFFQRALSMTLRSDR